MEEIHSHPTSVMNGHENNKSLHVEDGDTKIKSDAKAGFLRSARDGHLDKVLEHLKNNTDINTCNANGLNALHLASKEGHVEIVTELLKRDAAVDAATKKGNTALHIASLAGQEEVVKILVLQGASVNVQSQNGFTPLYMAAQENHDGVVRFLLANGANQSLATEDGFTPLAVALQQGHDKVVSVLLENDTRGKVRLPALHIAAKKDDCKAAALLLQSDHNPDVTSKSGFTPLHIAAHYGNDNIASLLIQKGADVNYLAKHHITPLHVAAKWGKANMATLLLDKHASLEAKTRDGLTPLHCAARSGHEAVVDLLLDRGAPISSKTKNGLAPLHMSAQGDHVDAARILLHHKAPVDEVTVDYLTALHVAAHCGHVRVAKLLLDRKADPNSRALNGFTPLHIACKKNRIKVVELLLKHGASIEATTESGLTPLHVASFMGCMNIVIYLLQHGAGANAPTMRGETPLHLAARANQTDIVRILLRNNAHVDARAREQQTPLHIASRLGNVDIAMLLLQHGADVDAATKDSYTPLHIAAKEGQDEVASVLIEHGASPTATTKRGFTPLHLAAKYGNMKVAKLLIQKEAPVDAQGKNGVTPLHVASHYDHQNVALLLLDKGASPHASAKNGYTPLHIAAKKNQMDIATTLLEYGAVTNSESKAGFTPLHLSSQEGHTDMSTLLIEHSADANYSAKNGLTPLHLCAQEDRVSVAAILIKNSAEINAQTKSGYTPLHVASHFGQMNMVRFLLGHESQIDAITSQGYTPLHQAAQQGHPMIVSLLLEKGAEPNNITTQGQTALSIAQKLGYITVIETLKVVTETTITTTTTTVIEEKYRVQAPETMQETFMSDSEDEGGEDGVMGDQSYRYLTVDEMKSLGDDSMPMDGMGEDHRRNSGVEETLLGTKDGYAQFSGNYAPDNVDLARQPINIGFLVSFMVDARGGAMRGCRHSGVRVIIPPRKAPCPMRITCRYLKRDKLVHPPPLMEGEALASRILELGPSAARFLGPVIIEVPHFAALRGKEREIIVLRSDNGETWKEHTLEATEEAVQEVLNESFDGEDLGQLEDMNTHRITRILTTDFPQYFAIVSRIRQEVHAIGPDGGMVSSTVVPQVQAVFPPGALTKKIKVGLQAQPIQPELVVKLLGNRVAVSPIVTVEPRRRKFHRPITLTIPVPQAAARGMINQYSGDTPTLRLLCSITGGTSRAQWEDVTGSTPLTFVNDCVSFTTTVSARFWLMDCRNVAEAAKMSTDLYREAINVPFMAKFVVFAKRHESQEARLRVFCMTDDKEEKTLETQEHFVEVAKSRDVEVLETKPQFLEFAGNLVPVTKSGEQLALTFRAFRENRLPFTVRVKDPHADPVGRIAFMREGRAGRGEPPQTPICNLNIVLPSVVTPETARSEPDLLALQKKYGFLHDVGLVYSTNKPESIHKADLRLSDICNLLGRDWIPLAKCLEIPDSDVKLIESEYPNNTTQMAMVMLKLWMTQSDNKVSGNTLEKALRKIGRDDIVNRCIFNVELVTDDLEKAMAKSHLSAADQSGFDSLQAELGSPVVHGRVAQVQRMERNTSLDVSFDEQDLMKESESIEEIPEKRQEEEHELEEVAEEVFVSEAKEVPLKISPEPESPRRIVPEEKGICDSLEAEKNNEEVYDQHDSETWGTRQSTQEERVIDDYVIETNVQPEEEEQPEVLISSSWNAPNTTDDALLEQEFTAALEEDQQGTEQFSAELLSRSLMEQPTSDDAKLRMSSSQTPPPSPFEAGTKATLSEDPSMVEEEEQEEEAHMAHQSEDVAQQFLVEQSDEPVSEEAQLSTEAAPSQDARLTSAGITTASAHPSWATQPLQTSTETFSPENTPSQPESRIPVLSKRTVFNRSASEAQTTSGPSRVPVVVPRVGSLAARFTTSVDSAPSSTLSTEKSGETVEESSSYSVRKQFWEQKASESSSSTTSSSSTSTMSSSTRQTKSERSSLVVTDESFSAPQRETKSERSSAVLSGEEDIYELGRYTTSSVIETSETTSEIVRTDVLQEESETIEETKKLQEIQLTKRTEETVTRRRRSGRDDVPFEEETTGTSQQHRIGREEYVYSSGDESLSLRAEDVESRSGVILPGGRQVVTEEFAQSSKTVYKDGQPVFVEQTVQQQSDSSPPVESAPDSSIEVNIGSQELPDIAVTRQESLNSGGAGDSESLEEEECPAPVMAFVNTGFIGVDHIDVTELEQSARAVSPFEVPRDDAYVIGTYGPDFEDSQAAEPESEEEPVSVDEVIVAAPNFQISGPVTVASTDMAAAAQSYSRNDSMDSQELETYGSEDDENGVEQVRMETQREHQLDRERLTPEEALVLAENLIEEIKLEAPRRAEQMVINAGAVVAPSFAQSSISLEETEQISIAECGHDEVIESVQIVQHESVDITDEELRSSFSAADLSPQSEIRRSSTQDDIRRPSKDLDRKEPITEPEVVKQTTCDPVAPHVEVGSMSPSQVLSPERESASTTSSGGSKLDFSSSTIEHQSSHEVQTPSSAGEKTMETGTTLYYSAVEAQRSSGSRPMSSDIEALTICSSEYDTAVSSASSRSTTTGEYHTAVSSVSSSHDSIRSDATDASETLMASALEHHDGDDVDDDQRSDVTPTDGSLDLNQMDPQFKLEGEIEGEVEEDISSPESPFEMVCALESEGLIVLEDDDDDDEEEEEEEEELKTALEEQKIQEEDEEMPAKMKRSQEMTFHPEPKPLRTDTSSPPGTPTPSEESPSLDSKRDADHLVFDYVTTTITGSTPVEETNVTEEGQSTTVTCIKSDIEETSEIQEGQIDVATLTSRSGSLASGTDVEVISRSVTISSSSISHESNLQSISTQITTVRQVLDQSTQQIPDMANVPDIMVHNASPINDRRFSYPENVVEVPELAREVIDEVPSDQEMAEQEDTENELNKFSEAVQHTVPVVESYVIPEENIEEEEEIVEEGAEYPEVDVEELVSPPALVARRIDPPTTTSSDAAAAYSYEMSFERVEDDEAEVSIEDLEEQKRWMEMQFEEAEDAAYAASQQLPLRTVQPLADIEEGREDEESLAGSDRLVRERLNKESLSSTPEFDVLSGRRFFTKGGAGAEDLVSVDSLTDFERLEQELKAERIRRQSNGSQDSLNGRGKTGQGDNISVNSLTEFERLERTMADAAETEERARQQEAALLSEIEEGHESAASESSDSCETLSGRGGAEGGDGTDESDEDYEQRMFEIDEIIRQAQTNIEQFADAELAVQVLTEVGHHHQRIESTSSMNEVTRSSFVDLRTESADSVDSIEPDFVAGAPVSSRTAATYRSYRTEVSSKHSSMTEASAQQQPESSLAGAPDSLDVFGPSSLDSLDSSRHTRSESSRATHSDSLQAMAGAESSSSTSEDLPREKQKTPPAPSTCSSDSLEPAARIAAAGIDSDSLMSGSMTSSGEAAGLAGSYTVELPAEIKKVTFRGPDIDEQMREFVERFAPGEDISETEVTDPSTGITHITRVTQRRAVVEPGELQIESAGATIAENLPSQEALEEYIRTRGPLLEDVDSFEMDDGQGNVQRVIRKRTISTDSTVTSTSLTTTSLSQSAFQIQPTESTPELTSSGAESADTVAAPASPARRPPHALSIDDDDDDAMDEVDSHEHDWRFAATEIGQQEEAAATIPRQPAEAEDPAASASSAAYKEYDPTCSAISESEPSLPSQSDWSDRAEGGYQ